MIKKRKHILFIMIVLILFLIIYKLFFTIRLEYKTDSNSYKGDINKLTKKLTLYEVSYCKKENCNNKTNIYNIKLSMDEYLNINSILKHKDYNEKAVIMALTSIVKDNLVMFVKDDEGYDEMDDIDNNGIVTYREFADTLLKSLSK